MSSIILEWLLVAVAVGLMDACWTMYFVATQNRAATKAACWSAGIVLLSAYATIAYVNDPFLLTAAVTGAWVGTYLTVRINK